jgi:hypothetical protein
MSKPNCICRICQNAFKFVLPLAQSICQKKLRSVLPLAHLYHLSAFSAAQETQIEFALFFFTQVSRCQIPSAFPEAAKM